MILNIAATLFVIGITFINTIFGLFSGLINAFCAIVALCVALGFWEPLSALVIEQGLHPGYAEPFTLALLYVVTLLVLRLAADNLIRGNVKVSMYLDWGGGAVCGFIIAQISVGVMVLSFMMLPFAGQAGLWKRHARDVDNEIDPDTGRVVFVEHPLWFRSTEFATGLFELLSRGSLRGTTTFAQVYPDFSDWVFWTGNAVQWQSYAAPIRDEQGDGYEQGIAVAAWWRQSTAPEGRYRKQVPTKENPKPDYEAMTYQLAPGHELLGVRLTLKPPVADRAEKQQPYHRFRPTQIRVVGDRGGEPVQVFPTLFGGADPELGERLRIADIDTNFSLPAGGDVQIDAYFEVSEDFTPRFVEYRRHARAALAASQMREGGPSGALVAEAGAGPEGGRGTGGPARFGDVIEDSLTGANERLPAALSTAQLRLEQVELRDNRVITGRFDGYVESLKGAPTDPKVEFVALPEGQKIFQIQMKARQAHSLAGQVFNFVAARTNQYSCFDDLGDRHPMIGYYALVNRDGQQYIEFVYEPDNLASRAMLIWQWDGMIRALQNDDDARVGMYFAVPPGRCVKGIESQSSRQEFGREYCVGKN